MNNPITWDPDAGCYREPDGRLILAQKGEIIRVTASGEVMIKADATREELIIAAGAAAKAVHRMTT